MPAHKIRIATRQSPLALWQANHIRTQLLEQWPGLLVELVPMITSGDKFLKDSLQAVGGKGLFVKELEEGLLSNQADIAVHSTKDVPAWLPEGLILSVICKRDNPRDALISRNNHLLKHLPPDAVIGTASLRRQSQLLAYRPDFQIKILRGNINTRLAKLQSGAYDAIVLAASGLERMGFEHLISEQLSEEIMLPTCGQGALSIECRVNDIDIQRYISFLNDPLSELCVKTERLVNEQLGGNCHTPLAVFCSPIKKNKLLLQAKILSLDGMHTISDHQIGSYTQAFSLAQKCTAELFAKGARNLLDSLS